MLDWKILNMSSQFFKTSPLTQNEGNVDWAKKNQFITPLVILFYAWGRMIFACVVHRYYFLKSMLYCIHNLCYHFSAELARNARCFKCSSFLLMHARTGKIDCQFVRMNQKIIIWREEACERMKKKFRLMFSAYCVSVSYFVLLCGKNM